MGHPDGTVVKNLPADAGDTGLIPGSRRSPGGGNGKPLQYSCLGNPMERGTWRDTSSWGSLTVGYDLVSKHEQNDHSLFTETSI